MVRCNIWKDKNIKTCTKVRIVNALVFSNATYDNETRITKKLDQKKVDSFELWFWRRLWRIWWKQKQNNKSANKVEHGVVSLQLSMGCA